MQTQIEADVEASGVDLRGVCHLEDRFEPETFLPN